MQAGMEPACSQACPTDSIQFGTIRDLQQRAQRRVQQLHARGETRAYLYGADDTVLGGLNAFYLLVDAPEVYGLPRNPQLPTRRLFSSTIFSTLGAVVLGFFGLLSLRQRRMDEIAERQANGHDQEGRHV
jgi:formate dehydrogenase iron-sulfur subunit